MGILVFNIQKMAIMGMVTYYKGS